MQEHRQHWRSFLRGVAFGKIGWQMFMTGLTTLVIIALLIASIGAFGLSAIHAQSCNELLGERGQALQKHDMYDEHGRAFKAEGGQLRELHRFLRERDPGFGGLCRVQNRRHEYLWVHRSFQDDYQPAMPVMPALNVDSAD